MLLRVRGRCSGVDIHEPRNREEGEYPRATKRRRYREDEPIFSHSQPRIHLLGAMKLPCKNPADRISASPRIRGSATLKSVPLFDSHVALFGGRLYQRKRNTHSALSLDRCDRLWRMTIDDAIAEIRELIA